MTDLHWNPFNDEELAVGTDVGLINFWRVTRDDGPRNEMQPEKVMHVGGEKVGHCAKTVQCVSVLTLFSMYYLFHV